MAYRAMYAWLLVVLEASASGCPGAGIAPLRVDGHVRGFFLTPHGELGTHELAFASRSANHTAHRLHPLWGTYYAEATITAPKSVSDVRVVAARTRRVLYETALRSPRREFRVPTDEEAFLGLHSRDGLALLFEVKAVDGKTYRARVVPQARLLKRPRLRIDWLDLVRIAEVRRLLREKGDEILPGLRADDVPFALQGDGEQCVLLDHPRPPKDFHRYRGPLPVPSVVHVGRRQNLLPAVTGAATEIGGQPTVVLAYRPAWCHLPGDAPCPSHVWRASQRLATITHEVCHVIAARQGISIRGRMEWQAMGFQSTEYRAIEAVEREVLHEALGASPAEVLRLLRDYLALRERRAGLSSAAAGLIEELEKVETSEGFAYYAGWRAGPAFASAKRHTVLRRVDPFFQEAATYDPLSYLKAYVDESSPETTWSFGNTVAVVPSLTGFSQVRVLHALSPALVSRAWTTHTTLRQALAEASGFSRLRQDERSALRTAAEGRWEVDTRVAALAHDRREARRQVSRAMREARADGRVAVRLRARLGGEPEDGTRVPRSSHCVDGFVYSTEGLRVVVERPSLLREQWGPEAVRLDLLTVLDPDECILRLRRDGDALRLRAKEVVLEAHHARARWRRGTLTVEAGNGAPLKAVIHSEREDEGQVTRTAWMAVPLLALTCGATWGQLPHHGLTTTVEGLFRDISSCPPVDEELTLDMLDEDSWPEGEWLTIVNETYSVTATATDTSYSRIAKIEAYGPNNDLLDSDTSQPPTTTLTAEGDFDAEAVLALKWKGELTHKPNCDWEFKIIVEEDEPPAPQSIVVKMIDGEGEPYAGASVWIWPEGKPEEKQTRTTDNEGKAEFNGIAKGNWMIRAHHTDGCDVTKGPYVVKKRAGVIETFQLWGHCGIKGKIFFDGPPDPTGVAMTLLQGETVITSGTVEDDEGPDGSYPYTIGPPMPSGDYTVKAVLGEDIQTKPVTVPDQCSAAHPDTDGGGTTVVGGAHSVVTGPSFTFDTGE